MSRNDAAHQQRQDLVKVYREALMEGVPLDKIEEKVGRLSARFQVAEEKEQEEVAYKKKNFRQAIPRALRMGAAILPTLLLLVGIGLVGSATFPILAYYVGDFSGNLTELKAPIPPEDLLEVTPLVVADAQAEGGEEFGTEVVPDQGPVMLNSALDYTDLSNWFQGLEGVDFQASQEVVTYTIDIPKVNVKTSSTNQTHFCFILQSLPS